MKISTLAKKTLASTLALTLLFGVPGPWACQAFAQVVGAGIPMGAAAESGGAAGTIGALHAGPSTFNVSPTALTSGGLLAAPSTTAAPLPVAPGLAGASFAAASIPVQAPSPSAAIAPALSQAAAPAAASSLEPESCAPPATCPFARVFGSAPKRSIAPTTDELVAANLAKLQQANFPAFQQLVALSRGQVQFAGNDQLVAWLDSRGWLEAGAVKPAVRKVVAGYVEGAGATTRVMISPEKTPGLFRPTSSREGIGPVKYAWWNAFYAVMQWFNKTLARDPNNKNSWDKWPSKLGLIYLISKIRFLRSDTLTDPYAYATTDNKDLGPKPYAAKIGYTADGTFNLDNENPQMGAANTRVGSNLPPMKVRPDVENMTPSAQDASKLMNRPVDEHGKDIVNPAIILNNLAGGWIQFQFHNFGTDTLHDSIYNKPHKVARAPNEGWANNIALIDRTTADPTRVTENGRPTPINERPHSWVQAGVYGANDAELAALRTHVNGYMKLDETGFLPEDAAKPGVDKTGFNKNYNPLLSYLHWLFTAEHNKIADHLRYFHPDWDDETIFEYARKINVAQIARIHTIQWTEDLLQHPTLQIGMHAEFYGLVGPRGKSFLMRLFFRHPWLGRLMKPITDNDTIWGMPGSSWEHHDGPFQVPKQFRVVYRLHTMVLSDEEIIEPGTDRTLDRIGLIDFVQHHTRETIEKYGYDVLAYSFVKKSAGALTLHNFPNALTKFENQQDHFQSPELKNMTNLAERDIFREREDGTGTYNEFRKSVGEPPVTSFLELTGGDAELAKEISRVYGGEIEKVDISVGILAEPKPAGFALSYTQFYQFVLNAPRRVKSLYHMTEGFTYAGYGPEGMDWVEHGGGMQGAMTRHAGEVPNQLRASGYGNELVAAMEGVTRTFAPWPDAEKFPLRMLEQDTANSRKIVKTNFVTLGLGVAASIVGVVTGALPVTTAVLFAAGLTVPLALGVNRLFAWRHYQKVWQAVYTDERTSLFPTLFKGEKYSNQNAFWGKLFALGVMDGAGMLAWGLLHAHPVTAALMLAVSLSGLGTFGAIKSYKKDIAVLQTSLLSRLRAGLPVTDAKNVPGATALEKRYWFLKPASSDKPVATLFNTFRALEAHGLPRFKAFMTAALSQLMFGPKTHKNMTWGEWFSTGMWYQPFAIYLPNLIDAQGYSNTRIFAARGNTKGLKPGDVDMDEFERSFKLYAPGRDYMTAYDMTRMREWNQWRDKQDGRGNPISRTLGRLAAKRRADQLIALYADRVVTEDGKHVPAVSKGMMLRVYQGSAQADITNERARVGLDPTLRRPTPTAQPVATNSSTRY
jgi:heme peroxidase